jgi:hypothetical protein
LFAFEGRNEYIRLYKIKRRRVYMTLKDYFEKSKGKGIIATADAKGKVGMAVYARPHFVSEKTAVFIMADRLMHKNLQVNPSASYLFVKAPLSDQDQRGKG